MCPKCSYYCFAKDYHMDNLQTLCYNYFRMI
uniref:Uncharacterized protein n=1 Tax=Arundo donax TaxID=35708 RepID=A0A0A9GM24_ARUDO